MSARIIETDGRAVVLDLSTGARLGGVPIAGLGVAELGALIDDEMRASGTRYAFGRWGEPRELYSNDLFAAGEEAPRTVHLGIDVFCAAGTPVFAPLEGVVEHVHDNARELDYGPLLILRHEADSGCFYTLYGHLSVDTLERMSAGASVAAGARIASVGEPPTNGNWPPHLHFQVINDLLGLGPDFPGVASAAELERWFGLSPSPACFFPECDSRLLEYSPCS